MMTLAKVAGADVAETDVVSLGSREALLVRRFDRLPAPDGEVRIPYLSAITLTGRAETDIDGSYMEIADKMRLGQVGCPQTDLVELYRRMVINVACGNTDDHLKNHGFLRVEGAWRLSKAFDVVPTLDGGDAQAISVGRFGTSSSYENLLSQCGRFGLHQDDATALIAQVVEATAHWREHFTACGVTEQDVRIIARRMDRVEIPQQGRPQKAFSLRHAAPEAVETDLETGTVSKATASKRKDPNDQR